MTKEKKKEMPSSSTKEAAKGEAILICLDNSWWMESYDSPMFQDQLSALEFYCKKKFKHPDTTVGVVGMAGCTSTSLWISPTKSLKRIIIRTTDGDYIPIGGYLDVLDMVRPSSYRLGDTDRQQRIVFFAGGEVTHPLVDAQVLGTEMKLLDQACDVISFGDPYMGKRKFFDTMIRFADNNGNCNICHVPPESSVLEAISRSHRFFIPRQSSSLQYTKKEAFEAIDRSHILIPRESKTLRYHDKKKPIDVYLKPPSDGADPNTDCPFCQTLLLTLKEKGVSYNTHFIDLLNKPTWFPKQNGLETLPLIKFHGGTWISNSDVIVGMIDKKYEGRSLATTPHFAYLGLKILPKLAAFLKTKDENDGTKQALLYELKELDKHISEHGPYVNGKEITAVDLSLAPKLYHLVKACLFYKNWDVLQDLKDLPNALSYTESLFDLDSFKTTKPCEENVIEGWAPKVSA